MNPDLQRQKKVRILLAALIVIIVGAIAALAIVLSGRDGKLPANEVDFVPEAFFDYKTQANIVNGEDLLDYFVYADTVDALTRDLHTFGRAAYDTYKNDHSKPIGFQISPDGIKKQDDTVTLEGWFGASENKVLLEAKLLKSKRMDLSITDTETDFNIDDTLPSNSKVNRFIGSLPIFGEGYNITYVSGSTVNIGLFFRDPNLRGKAYQTIVDAIGQEETDKLEITLSMPSQ